MSEYEVTVLVLVGPPAAGKSTIVDLLTDIGVPCKDTGDAIREEADRRYNGTGSPDEDYIWNVAELTREEHGDAGPTVIMSDWIEEQSSEHDVICISSCRDQAEVDWLRDVASDVLVVQIDADAHSRSERYINMKLDDDERRDSISTERVSELRQQLYERELRESPYPRHDVTVQNEDSTHMHEIQQRLQNVVEVIG